MNTAEIYIKKYKQNTHVTDWAYMPLKVQEKKEKDTSIGWGIATILLLVLQLPQVQDFILRFI